MGIALEHVSHLKNALPRGCAASSMPDALRRDSAQNDSEASTFPFKIALRAPNLKRLQPARGVRGAWDPPPRLGNPSPMSSWWLPCSADRPRPCRPPLSM